MVDTNGRTENMDELSEDEFDLLDELYFVQHFSTVQENTGWTEEHIITTLVLLFQKEFIKVLTDHDTEFSGIINPPGRDSDVPWKILYFLATKKGLMVHNGF